MVKFSKEIDSSAKMKFKKFFTQQAGKVTSEIWMLLWDSLGYSVFFLLAFEMKS
jgi:hypothetical protein